MGYVFSCSLEGLPYMTIKPQPCITRKCPSHLHLQVDLKKNSDTAFSYEFSWVRVPSAPKKTPGLFGLFGPCFFVSRFERVPKNYIYIYINIVGGRVAHQMVVIGPSTAFRIGKINWRASPWSLEMTDVIEEQIPPWKITWLAEELLFFIGDTCSKGCFSIVTLIFGGVILLLLDTFLFLVRFSHRTIFPGWL